MKPALRTGVSFNDGRLEYPPEYFVQHFSVCLPLHSQPLPRIIAVLDWNQQESNHYNVVR